MTELGRSQAVSIRPILAQHTFDRVYSSDLIRAVDTQRLALPCMEGIRTPWLREFDVGSIQGLPYDQVRGANPEWKALIHEEAYAGFDGESLDDVCTRVGLFLKELEQSPCQNVAAFAHNGVMGVMMRIVLGVNFDRGVFRTNNCGIHVFSDIVDGHTCYESLDAVSPLLMQMKLLKMMCKFETEEQADEFKKFALSCPELQNCYISEFCRFGVEFNALDATKGYAVDFIRDYLGDIHTVIGVGDFENDIPLVQHADISAAPANAAASVLDLAQVRLRINKEGAIKELIEKLEERI